MTQAIQKAKKLRLAKKGKQTRWAPYWVVPRVFGKGRKHHVGVVTAVKRTWRRTRTKV